MRRIVDGSLGSCEWISICVRVEISQAKREHSLQRKERKSTCTNDLIFVPFIHRYLIILYVLNTITVNYVLSAHDVLSAHPPF